MAAVWTTSTVDLVLPATGRLEPGSNTVYLGGPRLPADLKADGVTAAFIWYSSPQGLALGIDYWYLAHFNLPPNQTDLLQVGYKSTGGTRHAVWGGFVTNLGAKAAVFESLDSAILQTTATAGVTKVLGKTVEVQSKTGSGAYTHISSEGLLRMEGISVAQVQILGDQAIFIVAKYPGPGAVQIIGQSIMLGGDQNITDSHLELTHPSTNIVLQTRDTSGAGQLQLVSDSIFIGGDSSITEPYIDIEKTSSTVSFKAVNTTDSIDELISTSSSVTVAGVAATTVTWNLLMSTDRVLLLNLVVVFPTAPTTLNFSVVIPSIPASWNNMVASWYFTGTMWTTAYGAGTGTIIRTIPVRVTSMVSGANLTFGGGSTNPDGCKTFIAEQTRLIIKV